MTVELTKTQETICLKIASQEHVNPFRSDMFGLLTFQPCLKMRRIRLWSALVLLKKNRRGYERDARSDAYLRLRLSRYSDAANAEKATTATVLNSGTGIWFCCRFTFTPAPDWPDVTE